MRRLFTFVTQPTTYHSSEWSSTAAVMGKGVELFMRLLLISDSFCRGDLFAFHVDSKSRRSGKYRLTAVPPSG